MPTGRVCIAFDDPMLEPTPTWTRIDDTNHLVAAIEIRRGRQTEFDVTDTSTATVFLNDTQGLFDPANTGSPYFGTLDGKQIALSLWNPVTEAWVQQWRGFIDRYGYDLHPSQVVSNVQIECVDLFDYLAGVEMIPGTFGHPPPAGSEDIVFWEGADVQARMEGILGGDGTGGQPVGVGLDPSWFVIFTGNVDVQDTRCDPGDSVLVALRDTADAEFPGIANCYTDKRGYFVFHGRKARFDPEGTAFEADWTFTRWKAGDGAAIALDSDRAQLRPPLNLSRPRDRIINAALCYPRGLDRTTMASQIQVDATSIAAYGYRSWSAQDLIIDTGTTTGLTGPEECKLFADYYVANYKDPRTRVEALTFKALRPDDARATATWALLCGWDISDGINVQVGYPGGTGLVDEDFFIEGGTMRITPLNPEHDMVELSLNVSPAGYWGDDVGLIP